MQLSLAGWSLNRLFRDAETPLSLLEFPGFARDTFDIRAVELNNIYFTSIDLDYLDRLIEATDAAGSTLLNIAVDEKGDLAAHNEAERLATVERYADWIPVAAELGCKAIRANSGGKDVKDREKAIESCIDSFRRLADVGMKHEVAILIENHWGISSDPAVMTRLTRSVRETHGDLSMYTLVDWGNWPDDIDRYDAIRQVMPYAGAVHAKVNDIDAQLNHPRFDHARCLKIAQDAGYNGYLGIEYEGAEDPVVGISRGATLLRQLLNA
jgi:sugar phosphate isomerase/epimerase